MDPLDHKVTAILLWLTSVAIEAEKSALDLDGRCLIQAMETGEYSKCGAAKV